MLSLSTGWPAFKKPSTVVVLLMAEILHQLIGSLSRYLQCFIHPRWCRISSHQEQYSMGTALRSEPFSYEVRQVEFEFLSLWCKAGKGPASR